MEPAAEVGGATTPRAKPGGPPGRREFQIMRTMQVIVNSQTFGNYEERSRECEYLTLAFSPLSVPLRSRWRNNGLSADFFGDYVTTFLALEAARTTAENGQNEIKHAVTYIANELLENAMKYHERDIGTP